MERSDLGDNLLNNFKNFHIITVDDNIEHIEEKNVIEIKQIIREKNYLSFDVFIETVKSEMRKGNEFAEIYSNDGFTIGDLIKIKELGFDVYRECDKYWITWNNLK